MQIFNTLCDLIINHGADTFYLGSKSQFNTLCLKILLELKRMEPNVKIVYVRGTYVFRNVAMIEACDVLLTYCAPNYEPSRKTPKNKMMAPVEASKKPNSGTHLAVRYAQKRKKQIINLFS